MRGKRLSASVAYTFRGTTPHTRGKRSGDRCRLRAGGEQPRIRGEKAVLAALSLAARVGTTPHERGKWSIFFQPISTAGTTPHTRGIRAKRPLDPAHAGTTPHTRGKGASLTGGMVKDRNNPAHAGKSRPKSVPPQTVQEQPRIRGEKRRMMGSSCVPEGTTPRTRGKDSVTSRFIEHLSSCHSTGSYTTPIK